MKKAYDQYRATQKQIDFEKNSRDFGNSKSCLHNTHCEELNEHNIKEIDDSIRNLEAFIQGKFKGDSNTHAHCFNQDLNHTMNFSHSMNYFGVKKESSDYLDEMRNKSGYRSQTTKRLIQKIKNESVRSKHSNYDVYASLPSLNMHHNNLFYHDETDDVRIEDKEENNQIENKKKKCFEYSIPNPNYSCNNSEIHDINEAQPNIEVNLNKNILEI